MDATIADLTEGQTFTPTEGQFKGRTLTVKTIGATGRTLLAIDAVKGSKVFLKRNDTPVTVQD